MANSLASVYVSPPFHFSLVCLTDILVLQNPSNPAHMQDLADHWNVDVKTIPHWGQPTHIMSLLKYIEAGSVKSALSSSSFSPRLHTDLTVFLNSVLDQRHQVRLLCCLLCRIFVADHPSLPFSPAVSMPELARVRQNFASKDLFVIAQDIFPTETTALADVVLPAAQWAEKTGCASLFPVSLSHHSSF
jgi:ferredoxin-nitrate reductase